MQPRTLVCKHIMSKLDQDSEPTITSNSALAGFPQSRVNTVGRRGFRIVKMQGLLVHYSMQGNANQSLVLVTDYSLWSFQLISDWK